MTKLRYLGGNAIDTIDGATRDTNDPKVFNFHDDQKAAWLVANRAREFEVVGQPSSAFLDLVDQQDESKKAAAAQAADDDHLDG